MTTETNMSCVDRVIKAYTNADGVAPFKRQTLEDFEERAQALMKKYEADPKKLQEEMKKLVDDITALRTRVNKRMLEDQLKSEERMKTIAGFKNPLDGAMAIFEGARTVGRGAKNSIAQLRNVLQQEGMNLLTYGLKEKGLTGIANDFSAQVQIAEALHRLGTRQDVSKFRPEIVEIAKLYTKFNNWVVQTLRHHGIDVGQIAGYIMRQTHDPDKILAIGEDAWITSILPRLDMEKTFGEFSGDAKKQIEILKAVYQKITEDGNYMSGTSRFSKARSLHFKDGVNFMEYNQEFGYYPTILQSMHEVVRTAAREAAITSKLGSDRQAALNQIKALVGKENEMVVDEMWWTARGDDERAGKSDMAKNAALLRNIAIFTRLGGTLRTALGGDYWNSVAAIKTGSGISWMEAAFRPIADYLSALSPKERRAAAREYALNLEDQRNFMFARIMGQDAPLKGSKMAWALHWFFQLNGVGPHTQFAKAGDSKSLGRGLKHSLRNGWPKDEALQRALLGAGIDERDVQHLGLVEGNAISGAAVRRIPLERIKPPERKSAAAYREDLALRVQMHINTYVETGIPTPGKKESRQFGRYRNPDTVKGQLARFFSQFKMTPMKQFNDALYTQRVRGGVGGYLPLAAKIGMFTAIGGAQAYALHRLLQIATGEEEEVIYGDGKLDVALMGQMLARGGGLGLMGDYIFSAARPITRAGEGLAGPVAGAAFGAGQIGFEKLGKAVSEGEELEIDSQDLKFMIYNTPGLGLPFLYPVKAYLLETAKDMAENR